MPGAVARKTAFGRLLDTFHSSPHGRVYEFLFWAGIGVALLAFAVTGWLVGWISTPIAWMMGIVGACFFGWAFLPRARQRAPPPLPKGKRGEIAQQVRASKAEAKRKKRPGAPKG